MKAGIKAAIVLFAFSVLPILLAQQVEQLTIHKEFDPETLLFQLTMPGIDEEIFFRGILLGLMCSTLRSGTSAWSNPAIIINAILFGLGHALRFYEGEEPSARVSSSPQQSAATHSPTSPSRHAAS